MTTPLTVLHLTPHLGGGVGKALSGLVRHTPAASGIRHAIVCLEAPEKNQFVAQLAAAGCPVTACPTPEELAAQVAQADIVQLEWWGHPATFAALCQAALPPLRLLVWCHISGLHTPRIPSALLAAAGCGLLTSPATLTAPEVARLPEAVRQRLAVVHSSGGFDGLIPPVRTADEPLRAGYLGSLNFAKLHPHLIAFLAAVPLADFRLRLIGDTTNRAVLERQAWAAGLADSLDFRGYTTDVATELAAINVMPYLLNPRHYGTTENALLEAMAMGVVPVVLDNPAERCLVEDGRTGLMVRTPREFGEAMAWLARHPEERQQLGAQAAATVRERFAVEAMVTAFARHYRQLQARAKVRVPFAELFGPTPADWFLACQGQPELFTDPQGFAAADAFVIPGLRERTKGSVFHFGHYFPQDSRLSQWQEAVARLGGAMQGERHE